MKLATLLAQRKRLKKRVIIASIRASVAFAILFVLLFLGAFQRIQNENLAMPSMILVVIVTGPGKSTGDFVRNFLVGVLGFCVLAIPGYVILAQLGSSPVAQGFIFALLVYIAAVVRAHGRIYIPFYLFSILFAFQGIYTTVIENGEFSVSWLLGTLEAWVWGFAISIFVNSFIFPQSSERELLELIELSLDNVKVLSHLVCKTYEMAIKEDEIQVRDYLIDTIRIDYTGLTERVAEASYELIRFSKYTMDDYQKVIVQVQSLQQALITVLSTLELINTLDPKGVNMKRHLLVKSEASENFRAFRKGIDSVILEITNALRNRKGDHKDDSTTGNSSMEKEVKEEEVTRVVSQAGSEAGAVFFRTITSASVLQIGARLKQEVQNSPISTNFGLPSIPSSPRGNFSSRPRAEKISSLNAFGNAWDTYSKAHIESIISLIKSGSLDLGDDLQIELGAPSLPSLQSLYANHLPKSWTSSLASPNSLSRIPSRATKAESIEEVDEDTPCSEALTKSFSLVFGLKTLTEELTLLHNVAVTPRKRKIRIRILERFWTKVDTPTLTLQEGLAGLRGEVHHTPTLSLFRRLLMLEALLRSETSLYAIKVALATTVYILFLLSPDLQPFFLQYGISSSLITVIVGITPSLGQSLFTFILQLTGTGVGTICGLAFLEIFHQGGDNYSLVGLVFSLTAWAFITSCILYSSTKYYSLGLLSMNGAGVLIANEILHLDDTIPFGLPPIRAAYALVAMSISITIAAFFQIFLFRHSTRKQLRLEIAAVTFALSAYNTLLQSYINAVAPGDHTLLERRPTTEAVEKIQHEMIKREKKLQKSIINLSTTFEFAKVEPKIFPFQADVILKIIRSHQIILDRMREARSSLAGNQGFSELVHHDIVSKLYPYRIHSQRLARTLFYLTATSLISKTPLPRDVPSSRPIWKSFENDALILSRRLSRLPDGENELRKPGFLRYWFYLTALRAVSSELEDLEVYLGELFGVPEETNPNIS